MSLKSTNANGPEERETAPVTPAGAKPRSRRAFLGRVASTAAAAAVADLALGAAAPAAPASAGAGTGAARKAIPPGPPPPPPAGTFAPLPISAYQTRRNDALQARIARAQVWHGRSAPVQLANDDEILHPEGWANFSRALPHDGFGHPDPAAFAAFRYACRTGRPADFAAIPLGGVQPLRNPQSGLCLELIGADTHQTRTPPAPAFASAWRAAEMVEAYWAAILRDVPFAHYATDPLVAQACADLSALSDYRGPKAGGLVTPDTIFRSAYPGSVGGPWISQFLLKDIAFGAQVNPQQVRVFAPGTDFLTAYPPWLARQNGAAFGPRVYDGTLRWMRNARDVATWVDADPPLQAAYHALSILLQMHAPVDPSNPYVSQITNQDGFTTFGPVDWFDMIGRAPRPAHEAVWFHKFRVHRVLRPEEYAGRVHNHLTGAFNYPLHEDVLDSQALPLLFGLHGTYLCPQAYPDGAPMHCAYPSGHSVGVGSTVTMLKAIFDESFVIPAPVEPSADGLSLQPYAGPPLTVGGELNKLAFNIGMARVLGGIHWRSDVVAGNRLGEDVTLCILEDMKAGYAEPFTGFTLSRLDGSPVAV